MVLSEAGVVHVQRPAGAECGCMAVQGVTAAEGWCSAMLARCRGAAVRLRLDGPAEAEAVAAALSCAGAVQMRGLWVRMQRHAGRRVQCATHHACRSHLAASEGSCRMP